MMLTDVSWKSSLAQAGFDIAAQKTILLSNCVILIAYWSTLN